MKIKFKRGDFVRLVHGCTKMEIVKICSDCPKRGDVITTVYSYPSYYTNKGNLYKNLDAHQRPRTAYDYVLWDPKDPSAKVDRTPELTMERGYHTAIIQNKEIKIMNKPAQLFRTTHKPTKAKPAQYGTFLVVDPDGKYVLQTDTGIFAFALDAIEKVLPYTFSAKSFSNSHGNSEHKCHYICKKGDVAEGEILLSASGNMYLVTKINTACENPKKEFKGCKLATTKFGG